MQAVQRKVFPGADPRFFEPEIAPAQAGAAGTGVPATTPLADLTARVNSLEKQMTALTGHNDQNSFSIRQLEEQLAKFRHDAVFRLNLQACQTCATVATAVTTPPQQTNS